MHCSRRSLNGRHRQTPCYHIGHRLSVWWSPTRAWRISDWLLWCPDVWRRGRPHRRCHQASGPRTTACCHPWTDRQTIHCSSHWDTCHCTSVRHGWSKRPCVKSGGQGWQTVQIQVHMCIVEGILLPGTHRGFRAHQANDDLGRNFSSEESIHIGCGDPCG